MLDPMGDVSNTNHHRRGTENHILEARITHLSGNVLQNLVQEYKTRVQRGRPGLMVVMRIPWLCKE